MWGPIFAVSKHRISNFAVLICDSGTGCKLGNQRFGIFIFTPLRNALTLASQNSIATAGELYLDVFAGGFASGWTGGMACVLPSSPQFIVMGPLFHLLKDVLAKAANFLGLQLPQGPQEFLDGESPPLHTVLADARWDAGPGESRLPLRAIIYNEDNIERKIRQPSNYKDSAWVDVLDNVTTYWFAAVTMAEYTIMLNENNEIDKLPGKLRKPGNWEQFIMVPTMEEAIQWLAYHQSMSHTMSSEETIVLAIAFDAHNMVHRMSQKMLTSFQRGYSVQVLQVHAPYDYVFTEAEKNNLRAMYLNYNAANKFDKYNWSNGWIWNYGHTMHVRSMLTISEDSPRHTIFGMALAHLGQFGQSQLPPDVQLALGVYEADKKIDTYHVTIPKRHQRGHPEERDRTIVQEKSED
eukprot:s314_g35.t2